MRELLDLQAELAAHEDALVSLANNVARGEEIVRIIILLCISDCPKS